MNIIIDGYNITGTGKGDLQKLREELIGLLVSYHRRKGHDITLVFDGWKDGRGKETKAVTGGITVIYSGLGERADHVIKRIVSERKKKWAVVSSDREIENAAWKYSCVPVDSDSFLGALERSLAKREIEGDIFDDLWRKDEDEHEVRKTGSSRQLSRKQKEIRRILKKL